MTAGTRTKPSQSHPWRKAAVEPKRKRCKVCPTLFVPRNSLQVVCSWECGQKVAQSRELLRKVLFEADRAERRERRQRLVALRSRSDWMKLAQVAVNRYVRERDAAHGCISCHMPASYQGQWHAGHYRSTAAAPELRFDERNVHKQCAQCNTHKSGNVVEYRLRLIERIGQAGVDYLEGPHEAKHYSIDALKDIIKTYRAKLRALRKGERAAA